jgi:hypothetical protein
MKKNLGTLDRIVRTILGLGLIAWGVMTHNWLGAIGAVPLLTAMIGFCPVYCPLRLSTAGKGGDCCGGGK